MKFKKSIHCTICETGILDDFPNIKCVPLTNDVETCNKLRHKFVSYLIKLCTLGFSNLSDAERGFLILVNDFLDLEHFVSSIAVSEFRTCTVKSNYPHVVLELDDNSLIELPIQQIIHSFHNIPVGGFAEIILKKHNSDISIPYCRRISYNLKRKRTN